MVPTGILVCWAISTGILARLTISTDILMSGPHTGILVPLPYLLVYPCKVDHIYWYPYKVGHSYWYPCVVGHIYWYPGKLDHIYWYHYRWTISTGSGILARRTIVGP